MRACPAIAQWLAWCGAAVLLALCCVPLPASAQTSVQNSATVTPPDGMVEATPADNTASVDVEVYAVTIAKTGSPASGVPVAAGDTIGFNLTVTVSGATTAEATTFTDSLSAGLSVVAASLPADCSASGQTITCVLAAGAAIGSYGWSYRAQVAADAGGSVGNSISGGQGCTDGGSCSTTHPVYFGVSLGKRWDSGRSGDAVDLAISGDADVIPLAGGTSSVDGTTTPATAAAAPGARVDLAESFSSGSAGNYTSTLACVRNDSGADVAVSGSGGSGSVVMPADTGLTCTFANVRRTATLVLVKQWTNARVGETATVSSSGFANVASSGTSTSSGNNSTSSSAATVYAGESGTIGELLTNPENYASTLACTGNATPLAGTTLTVTAGDDAIRCVLTNTRRQATLTLSKTWVDALPGDTATVSSTGFENAASSGLSTSSGDNTTTGQAVVVYAGESGSIDEVLSNAGNYDATLACSGNATPLSATTLTVDPADSAISCVQTNTRRQASLTLRKTWVDAAAGEAVTITASGSSTGAIGLSSVADSSNETDAATPQPVYAGETLVLSEAFALPANAANYTSTLSCTGSSGLTGNTLVVAPGDSAIVCTFSNTRPQTTLQLVKQWAADSRNGDVAQLAASSGLQNNTNAFTSTASIGANSASVVVYVGEQAVLPAETMSGGALDNYTVGLGCSGGNLSGSDGKQANIVTVAPADAGSPIVCTYTNTRNSTTLTLQKTWLNALANDEVSIVATGLTPLSSTATGGASQTDTGAAQTVHAGDVIGLTESFSSVTSNLYATTLACTGSDGLVVDSSTSGTLTVGPDDGPVTCRFVNDRKHAELVVRKAWNGGGPAATVAIPASSGFANNTPAFSSTSPGPDQVGPVTVYAFENGVLGAESFTAGTAGDYTSTLACDGNDANPADGLAIAVADADSTITCTYSNTFVPRAALAVDKSTTVPAVTAAGQVIPYQITVSNSGNVPLGDVTLDDPLIAVSLSCTPALPVASLAAGASISCSGSYTVTQADIDRQGSGDGNDDGVIHNSVGAAGTDPDGAAVDADDSTDTTLPEQRFVAEFSKTPSLVDSNGSGAASVGEEIDYGFTVTNAGNTTIDSITIADPRLPGLSCAPSGPLAPGERLTFGVSPPADVACTGTTYTVTQDDLDTRGGGDGDLDNAATANAVGPGGGSASGDATSSVPLDPPAPRLVVDKSASPGQVTAAGQVVSYTVTVSNPGNVTIEDIAVSDPMSGMSALVCTPATPFTLAPGASATCTANYTVTQDDLDNRSSIDNTATASGSDNGNSVSDDDSTSVVVTPGTGRAELVKLANRSSVDAVGDQIVYTFRVSNPSALTLENLQLLSDSLLGSALVCQTIASLAPGASADFSCTGNQYTVQQSDIDAQGNPLADSGVIRNEASGQAQYQIGSGPVVVVSDTAAVTVALPQRTPSIFLTKSSDVGSVSAAGQGITYGFSVRNIGNVTLSDVTISDPLLPALICPPLASLAPGATVAISGCSGNVYTVTQADIDSGSDDTLPGNGQLDNVATASATTPAGSMLANSDSHEVNLPVRSPQMTLVKSADTASVSAPGTINYRFTVANTGNVTLEDVSVSDATLGLACASVELAPGASAVFGGSGADVVCTGNSHAVTQADIDSLTSIDNTATASGRSQFAGALSRSDSLSIPVARDARLALSKSADVAAVTSPGDAITYTVIADNTGNVSLVDVDIADPLLPAMSCTPAVPVASLAPRAQIRCEGRYVSTQEDFDTHGGGDQAIDNTATATWNGGSSSASARVTLPLPVQSLRLDKSAGTPTIAQGLDAAVTDAGDTIPYTFVVTNTGNQSLAALAVIDANLDATASCDRSEITASGATAVATCSGVHTITQSDMDNGTVSNSATAEGTPPGSARVSSAPDQAVVTLVAQPQLVLAKSAGAPTTAGGALAGITDAGDTIGYGFVLTNAGNVTLNNLTIADPLPGMPPITCAPGQLAPGASRTCSSVVYTITQADMDAGVVANTATATGTPPGGSAIEGQDSTSTPLAAGPAISLDKTAAPQTYSSVGQTIGYSYAVANTGNVSVSALAIGDDRIASIQCPVTTLVPGQSTTCSGSDRIVQADLDAGSVTNTASATATPAQGTLAAVSAQETITAVQTRSLALDKTSPATSYAAVGERIDYRYLVSNDGNITVTDAVGVDDDRIVAPATVNCPALPAGGLAPGASLTCTASYTVTQADLDAGSVVNTANAHAGALVSPADSVTIAATQAPALVLDKTSTSSGYAAVGDVLAYRYRVGNAGNVTLTSAISVADDRIVAPSTVSCPALPAGGLAPGDSLTCTGSYAVTQADLDAGSVVNTATASAGSTQSPPDSVTIAGTQAPALTMAKAVSAAPQPVVLGSVLEYIVTGTNSGNTTLANVVISDDRISPSSTTCATLAPAAACVLVGSYTVTQADVDAGQVRNIGSGISDSTPRTPSPPTVTPVQQLRGLGLDKTSGSANYEAVGDRLDYRYLVSNTGTVTVTAPITVSDDRIVAPATVSCPALPAAGLAPGASLTCSASYTVTQADLDRGSVTNTASASDGSSASAEDTVTIAALQRPALTLDKTASVADSNGDGIVGDAGDVIAYAFALRNTGNVVLAPVTVRDPLLPALTCSVASLAPGASASCSASNNRHAIDNADELAGSVVNTATATGDAPGSAPDATASDSTTTPTALTPAVATATKTAQPASATEVAPGDTLQFTLGVRVANAALHEAVTLTDTLGSGLVFVAIDAAGAFACTAGSPLVCTLPAGTTPGSYAVRYRVQVEADATGSVVNTVVATKPPGTDPAPGCVGCRTEHPIVPSSARVSKRAEPASGSLVERGQALTYTLTTVVAGSITTQPLLLRDSLDAGLSLVAVTDAGAYACTGALACTLPAGTLPGRYPLRYQVAVDADANGELGNQVVASNPPGGDPEPVCERCATRHTVIQPALETDKRLAGNDDPDHDSAVSTGDTLTYTVRARNTGNVPLSEVTIDDPLLTPTRRVCALLAPGADCALVGRYQVTQADTDTGSVDNVAAISAAPGPDGAALPPQVCPPGSADARCRPALSLPIVRRPALAASKSATLSTDRGTPGKGNIDDVIRYAVGARNTGNVTLDDLHVEDTLQRGTAQTLDCSPTRLAPGQAARCAEYEHTISEVEAGSADGQLRNSVLAVATPTGAGLAAATATAAAVVEVENAPAALRVSKRANVGEVKIGDLVRYSLTVQNVGDIDLVDGYLLDSPPAGFSYVEGSLQGDDDDHAVTASGQSPLRVGDLDIAAGNTATLSYLMRVGAGVRPGTQVNHAQAFAPSDQVASNVATAEVVLGDDPLLDDSLIVGSVFDDRDRDGWQDSAALGGLRVQGGFDGADYVAGSTTLDRGDGAHAVADASAPLLHGLALGELPARSSPAEPARQIVLRQQLRAARFSDDFVLTSAQGVTLRMDAAGRTRLERDGPAARGLNAAEPTVQRRVMPAAHGYLVDYVIANQGIDERGVPGVRIASVEGLLMETDQYGRYHLVDIAGGGLARGRNFVLKVDPATLPEGTVFTTANPLLRRITPGLPTRFDFGVTLPVAVPAIVRPVEIELGEVLFAPDSAELQARYRPAVRQMADTLRAHGGGEVLITANAAAAGLALARAAALRAALLEDLGAQAAGVRVEVRAQLDDPASLLVAVEQGGARLGTVLFDTGSSVIRADMQPLLQQLATLLQHQGGGRVLLVGHADVRGSDAANLQLGLHRAEAVYAALRARLGTAVLARVEVSAAPDAALDSAPAEEPR